MTEINEKFFLERLYDVIRKLVGIAKTQNFRFQQKWNEYLSQIDVKPHLIRQIPLDKDKFLSDIDYRIKTLEIMSNAVADGYHAIKNLLKALYGEYFSSKIFKTKYSKEDQTKIKYLVAKEILGNLIQYNKIDHETVPLKYNILARNYTMIKLKSQKDEEILKNMNKIFNDELDMETIQSKMKEIEKDGIISIEKKDDENYYTIEDGLELSEEGQKKYNESLSLLINWPTNFWRSFYNIRELNITPSSQIKNHELLEEILSRCATQGFGPVDYVFKNLIKYFEEIKN
ncbi:MAG: hypothetical protein ACQERB_15005 [Promethearchaeati archaeon]